MVELEVILAEKAAAAPPKVEKQKSAGDELKDEELTPNVRTRLKIDSESTKG